MSYGSNITDMHRLAGALAGFLKGDKPADLPVQQATKIELYINLKDSQGAWHYFSAHMLGRADEVIE